MDVHPSAAPAGDTNSGNFPVLTGSYQTSFHGTPGGSNYDGFVMKIPFGSGSGWSSYLGGSGATLPFFNAEVSP